MVRGTCVVLALLSMTAAPVTARQSRDALIRDGMTAADNFDFQRAVELLTAGIDPNRGPADRLWQTGLERLAEMHINQGRDSLAAYLLRWGARRSSALRIDPDALAGEAFASARAFVRQTAANLDSLGATSWRWVVASPEETRGTVRVESIVLPTRVQVLIVGAGLIEPGSERPIDMGSYTFEVSAAGYQTMRLTREVLPGVTTVLAFRPTRQVVAARPRPAADPVQLPTARRGGGFPFPLALLGVVGAGAAAFLLLGGDDGGNGTTTNGDTGGIIVTLPKN